MKCPFPTLALLLFFLQWSAAVQAAHLGGTLEFIENKGQWNERARFAAAIPGGRLFVEDDGLRFVLLEAISRPGHGHSAQAGPTQGNIRAHALGLRFEQPLPGALSPEERTAEHRNYFLGADARHWASDVRSFRQLRYPQLWPGIGARFYENEGQQLEYDFELAPGADPAAIGLRPEGAEQVSIDENGALLLRTSVGPLRQLPPRAWQTDAAGRRQAVACRYVLRKGVVRFALGRYDTRRPLIIDPVVVFSTYSGSMANNWGFTATYDPQGNLYSGGIALEPGYPVSPGAFQTTFASLTDIAIIKYNTRLNGPASRVWATLIGGHSSDYPSSLVVNSQGELLVLGSSGSSDYPTSAGALQRSFRQGTPAAPFGFGNTTFAPNGSDLVISRLSAGGTALLSSTYLGGSGNDGLVPLSTINGLQQLPHNYGDPFRSDITVDAQDNIYIASSTTSADFPAARGFSSQYRGGSCDGVVCKLSPDLTALSWASFLGGSAADAAYSIQLAPGSGDVYVAGGTMSPNFPTTLGSYLSTARGDVDGFVVRIAADGTSLRQATYLGTADYDQAYCLQLGSDGGVYALGQTLGSYPTTSGLYTTPNGTQFIHKLDANLSSTLLATVFGSTLPANQGINISPTAFLVDRCDRVYVCGWGGDANINSGQEPYLGYNVSTQGLPTTPDAVQRNTDGKDFYLAQFAAGLTALSYATFYGDTSPGSEGDHVDGGTSRFDPRGVVYQAVCSCFSPSGFPVPPGANTYSPDNNSAMGCNNSAFVLNFEPNIAQAGADQTLCANSAPLPLQGLPAGGTWTGPGVSGSVAAGFVFTPSAALTGVQTLTYTVLSTGSCTTTATQRVTVTPGTPGNFAPVPPLYCLPAVGLPGLPVVPLSASPTGGTFSGPGVGGNATTGYYFDPNQAGYGTHTLRYSLTGSCAPNFSQTVQVLAANAGPDLTLCESTSPYVLVGSPAGGVWNGPGVSGSVGGGFFFLPSGGVLGANTITYTMTALGGSCSAVDPRVITVVPAPPVSFPPLAQTLFCLPPNGSPALPAVPLSASPAGGSFSGPGVTGSVATGFQFDPALAGHGSHTITYQVGGFCITSRSQTVRVVGAVAGPDLTICSPSPPLPLTGSPAGGSWSGPGVSGSVAAGFVFTPSAALAGPNVLTYTFNAPGACTVSSSRVLTVVVTPTVSAAPLPELCATSAAQALQGSPAGGTWTGPGVSGNPATGYQFSPSVGPGTYQLSYTFGSAPCPGIARIDVTVMRQLVVTTAADTILCPGSSQPFRLRASPAGGSWSGPGVSGSLATGFVFTPPPGFMGSVNLLYSVSNSTGCVGVGTRRVAMAVVPTLLPTWEPAACPADQQAPLAVRFVAPRTPGVLSWDFGDGSPAETGFEVVHTYPSAGRYTPRATLRYLNGQCEEQVGLAMVEVKDEPIPNVITPNQEDRLNHSFRLPPGCPPRLQIFSRWGQRVFESAAYQNDWSAEGQPAGVYHYLLEYPDGRRVRGWVEVVK